MTGRPEHEPARTPDAEPVAPADAPPGDPAGLLAQLTAATARLWGAVPTAVPPVLPPGLPGFPQIGTLTAQQVTAMVNSVRAQRHSIAALRAQLDAFDDNLASLEQLLEPLRSWTAAWAGMERGLTPRLPEPPAQP